MAQLKNPTVKAASEMAPRNSKKISNPTVKAAKPQRSGRQRVIQTPVYHVSNTKGYRAARPQAWNMGLPDINGMRGDGGDGIGTITISGTISHEYRIIHNLLNCNPSPDKPTVQRWSDIVNGILPEGEEVDEDKKIPNHDDFIDEVKVEMDKIDQSGDDEIDEEKMLVKRQINDWREEAMELRNDYDRETRPRSLNEANKLDQKAQDRLDQFEDFKKVVADRVRSEREDKRHEMTREREQAIEDYNAAVERKLKELKDLMEEKEIPEALNLALGFDKEDEFFNIDSIEID